MDDKNIHPKEILFAGAGGSRGLLGIIGAAIDLIMERGETVTDDSLKQEIQRQLNPKSNPESNEKINDILKSFGTTMTVDDIKKLF